jgi:activator of 2-hydroxyglutaryl-CoA dehydratase
MKTVFFQGDGGARNKQVFMQSACSGGTGTFIEKTARKLGVADRLPRMQYGGHTLHKISSKCGIFAEADSNTLVKAGVPIEEIIASLFEAVVYQNLATLTKGNTPAPEVLLLGGPNLFFKGLQEAWRFHLRKIWEERKVPLPEGRDPESLVLVPENALYYAALGCVDIARGDANGVGIYQGRDQLDWWIRKDSTNRRKSKGDKDYGNQQRILRNSIGNMARRAWNPAENAIFVPHLPANRIQCLVGCDFGSTTAKAVCLSLDKEILFTCYALSAGNPIEDAKSLFREIRDVGTWDVRGVGITGYGAELLQNIVGADAPIVETVAHAAATLHFFPDANCICDVGGVDVKIMVIKNGTVSDFRLNSQCSSGNGAFLQGVAERFNIPLGGDSIPRVPGAGGAQAGDGLWGLSAE